MRNLCRMRWLMECENGLGGSFCQPWLNPSADDSYMPKALTAPLGVAALRESAEWRYVEREVDIRLTRDGRER